MTDTNNTTLPQFDNDATKSPDHPLPGEIAVLVTTVHRGVFFGYAKDIDGATINLRRARNCVYWHQSVKGFLGLCSTGPNSECRVGPPANMTIYDITCVAQVEPEAVKQWEANHWAA